MASSSDPRWRAELPSVLFQMGRIRAFMPFCWSSKHTECDIPRACRDEAVALQEADVSLCLDRCMPIGPASTNYEASVPFDLYGTLALTSLDAPARPFFWEGRGKWKILEERESLWSPCSESRVGGLSGLVHPVTLAHGLSGGIYCLWLWIIAIIMVKESQYLTWSFVG